MHPLLRHLHGEEITVTLTGKTARGQQRVQQWGKTWTIQDVQADVKFSHKPGPWLLLKAGPDTRWVHLTQDPHFTVDLGTQMCLVSRSGEVMGAAHLGDDAIAHLQDEWFEVKPLDTLDLS